MELKISSFIYRDIGEYYFVSFDGTEYSFTFSMIEEKFGKDFKNKFAEISYENNGEICYYNENLIFFKNRDDIKKVIEELEPHLIMVKLVEG